MNKLPISVCIISGNEAARIGRALASVAGWTQEIIVVLNDSVTDGTETIAASYGARIFREPWKGHVAQKNSALAKASQEWILGLDADEELSPALQQEIAQLFSSGTGASAGFSFPRLTCFCGRWIRHGDWYPDRKLRLARRNQARWVGIDPHDKLQVEGPVGRLRNNLLHYTAESIEKQTTKNMLYAEDFARHCLESNRHISRADLFLRPCWRFFRAYILKLGFLDGWQGYGIAWMTGYSTFLRYAKAQQALLERKPKA